MNTTSKDTHVAHIDCILYRTLGFILFIASLINLFVTCRYFFKRYHNQEKQSASNRLSPIMTGMLISSILVIFFGIPVVMIQCFSCRANIAPEYFCKFHGFICFTTGIFNMYMVALLSLLRYMSILHKSSCFNRLLERYRYSSTLLCAITAICWSLPPLFKIGNEYAPEGVGFYCSLKWDDPSTHSRVFLLVVLFVNYILPFFLIIYTNLRVWYTLRCLLKSCYMLNYTSLPSNSPGIKADMVTSRYLTNNEVSGCDLWKALSYVQLKETTNRLQRLKIDRRYAYMTAMISAQYFLVWTPYAIVAILGFLGQTTLVERHPFWPTLFALLAKLSLILNPIILIYTSKVADS